jgi:hypothetical protein
MKTIDQWSADAKENISNNNGFDIPRFEIFAERLRFREERILSLIELVRKKDEKLKIIKNVAGGITIPFIATEALALTEVLK